MSAEQITPDPIDSENWWMLEPKLVTKSNYKAGTFDLEIVINGIHYVLEANIPTETKEARDQVKAKYADMVHDIKRSMVSAASLHIRGLKIAKP